MIITHDRRRAVCSDQQQTGGQVNLGGLGVVQVPELDVAVAGSNEVRAVV